MNHIRLLYFPMLTVVLLLSLCCITGCVKEPAPWVAPTAGDQITLTIKVPAPLPTPTRAIVQGQLADNQVESVDVLFFDYSTKMYKGKAFSDKIVNVSATEKTVTLVVPKGRYDLMVLANASSIVGGAITPANTPLEKNKSEIEQLLVKTLPNRTAEPMTGIWSADPSSPNYKHFPLWGEKLDFDFQTSGVEMPVSLVRMLAKVNVTFSSKEVSDKLEVESIMVCNYNRSGYLASSGWDFGVADGVAQPQANVHPLASREVGVAKGVVYSNEGTDKNVIRTESAIQICKDEIFLFETSRPADPTIQQQRQESTCLIVKGKYENASQSSYYRIDFASRVGESVTYLSLLRNHVYSVVINSVNTAGHPTPEIAYESFAADLNIGISSWSDGGVGQTAFDGQYTLSITPSELEVSREASTANSFVIHTDYPVAPTISGTDYTDAGNAGWIENISSVERKPLLDKQGGVKKAYLVSFDALENKSGENRFAKINVTAGRHLNLKVSVTQTAVPILLLRVDETGDNPLQDISEIIFPSGLCLDDPIETKSIRVTWSPSANNNPCRSMGIGIGTDFDFGNGYVMPNGTTNLINLAGIHEYVGIKPSGFTLAAVAKPNEFLEKTRLYTYTVSNGVKSLSKSVMIRQVNFNAVADRQRYYLMNGREHSLFVRSNSGWEIRLGDKYGANGDPKSVVKTFETTRGGYNTEVGQKVSFTLIDDIGAGAKVVKADVLFTIFSTDPTRKFDPVEVSINALAGEIQELSNSYMVLPGGVPILIPVKRANGFMRLDSPATHSAWWLGDQITEVGANSTYQANLLWSDNSQGLDAQGTVSQIIAVGSGEDGYVLVIPGAAKGNAVVALRRTPAEGKTIYSGAILWSWHIWVTDYHPYDQDGNVQGSGTGKPLSNWMNRNLGAKTNLLGMADAYGLHYQFGRKDPFPPSAALKGNGTGVGTGTVAGKPLYDENGAEIRFTVSKGLMSGEASIRNPMSLSGAWWYGTFETAGVSTISVLPWDAGGLKSIFDPCPKGYRVPRYSNTAYAIGSLDWGNEGNFSISTTSGTDRPLWVANGMKWDDRGGYYPAAGYLWEDGGYSDVGNVGYAWTVTPSLNPMNAHALKFYSTTIEPKFESIKSAAGSVRCVAEK